MTVTAGICVGGRLPASSLSSSSGMKIDAASWKHARGGVPILENSESGGAGVSCPILGLGDMLSPGGGIFPGGVRSPLPISSDTGGWGMLGRDAPAVWGIIPAQGGGSAPTHPGTKSPLSVGQPHPRGLGGR